MASHTEELYRLRKALCIALWLMGAQRHSSEVANANAVGRMVTMEMLRKLDSSFEEDYLPSDETWRVVIEIMTDFEVRATICQASRNVRKPVAIGTESSCGKT